MKIRNAEMSDINLMKEGLLDVRLIEKRPQRDIPISDKDVGSFKQGIRNKMIKIAENDNGEPVGFIFYRTDLKVPYVSGNYLWIDLIYVKEEERGKGIGTALYRDAEEYARRMGLDRIVIDIFEPNMRSKEFHAGLDFEPFYTIHIKKIDNGSDMSPQGRN